MKNKEFYKLLKKNKLNSNSGFTLTELLVGLFMSIFVIGALGFGLMTVLANSQSEGSKAAARNETGRALDFISDELRSAQSIETDNSITYLNTADVAPDYPLPTDGTARLALQIPGVSQRVIYSVARPETGSPWKGPLVIYRWGPELTANGSYSATSLANPGDWDNEALIDKVDDTEQVLNLDCDGDGNDEEYEGFFACVIDDDADGIDETADSNDDGFVLAVATDVDGDGTNETADTASADVNGDGNTDSEDLDVNEDGKIDLEDNADADGKAITAQLFFTGETLKVSGDPTDTDSYSADTQTVARARTAPANTSEDLKSYTMSFRTLDPSFACKIDSNWTMRTDFGESLASPGTIANWNHQQNRQPQPIKISGNTLVISSVPRSPSGGASSCDNERINNGRELSDPANPRNFSGNINLGESEDWAVTGKENVVAISHYIDFNDPTTFNGDKNDCNSNHICSGSNNGKVNTKKTDGTTIVNGAVAMLKRGTIVPPYGGYDANGNGVIETAQGDQPSLGEFLHTQSPSLATKTPTGAVDANGNLTYTYQITNELQPDERIIGFEVGQTDTTKPGFDLQDNIFIVKSEAFSKEYDYTPLP